MEELLNKLIEKGWKPFGWGNIKKVTNEWWFCSFIRDSKKGFGWMSEISHRELVSKESWLWQFVCENEMVRLTEYYWVCNWIFWENIYYDESATEKFYTHRNYEYRLIETSLKNEDELEQFLLENIKVE